MIDRFPLRFPLLLYIGCATPDDGELGEAEGETEVETEADTETERCRDGGRNRERYRDGDGDRDGETLQSQPKWKASAKNLD